MHYKKQNIEKNTTVEYELKGAQRRRYNQIEKRKVFKRQNNNAEVSSPF
jgi:hypothetical protein